MMEIQLFTLDLKGIISSLFLLFWIFVFGREKWVYFLIPMLTFLVASWIVTNIGKERKKKMKKFEKYRSVQNVVANGGFPALMILGYYLTSNINFVYGYLGAVAAITSDKFASEIGILDGIPRRIIGFKPTRKGESGGVTLLGSFAGLVGSFAIGVVSFMFPISALSLADIAAIAVSGFVGNIFDSIFGVFEEQGIGNKHTTNFICAAFGGLSGVALKAAGL